jgi:hypothetical protein
VGATVPPSVLARADEEAAYFVGQFAAVGGLLSYGPSISWMYRQAGE